MRSRLTAFFLALLALSTIATAQSRAPGQKHESLLLPPERAAHMAYEQRLLEVPEPGSLRRFHDLTASEPHCAGTPGDRRVIEAIAAELESMGLEVEVEEFEAYLPSPVSGLVEIVAPERKRLPIQERAVEGDPFANAEGVSIGFNAYSATGDVTGRVVYANYGRKEDFERLQKLGVDVEGAIVIARYGGNFRGYKANFAEEAGAIGLIIYSDPKDVGFAQGLAYPEGGYANEWYIQRGSILTLPHVGDPLTPGSFAAPGADRLDPASLDFPKIPVQPIGYGAAQEILSRMQGAAVPQAKNPSESWQAGLPFTYRLMGGDDLRVRVAVEQKRGLVRTANVIARLPGERLPDEEIVIGCHHDAWDYGAQDPACGLIVVMETARAFAEAAAAGERPDRTLVFAAWGAEEHGIVGSVEHVERREGDLRRNGVAYINLDAAVFGMNLRSSASPALQALITDVANEILPREDDARRDIPFGLLGGGSDHVGFMARAGMSAASFGLSGASGVAYHSPYDNLHWYRQVMDDDYTPHARLTRFVSAVTARLGEADLLPLDPEAPFESFRGLLDAVETRAEELEFSVGLDSLRSRAEGLAATAADVRDRIRLAVINGDIDRRALDRLNRLLLALDRVWLSEPGLPDRAWYRNLYSAPDETSGYAASPLPALSAAIERENPALLQWAVAEYERVFDDAAQILAAMDALAGE